jgi:hypothetical protein
VRRLYDNCSKGNHPVKSAENAQTTQYTSTDVQTIIDKFTVNNTTGGNVTFAVNLVNSGGAAGAANLILSKTILGRSVLYLSRTHRPRARSWRFYLYDSWRCGIAHDPGLRTSDLGRLVYFTRWLR